MQGLRRITGFPLVVGMAVLLASASALATVPHDDTAADRELRDAIAQIQRHYLKPMTYDEIVEHALKALLADLDPYSKYLTPAERVQFEDGLAAHFSGVGVVLDFEAPGGEPAVRHLMLESPAGRAGLQRGDRIANIDGHATKGATPDQVIDWLRGAPATQVTLEARRVEHAQPIRLIVARGTIAQPSVRGFARDTAGHPRYMLDPAKRIGYIRINRLADDTVPAVLDAMQSLHAAGMQGLVLDLRDCIGGKMEAALGVADIFIGAGRMLTVLERDKTTPYDAKPGEYTDLTIVVMINAGTASSGEILAGAMKDSGRAVLVGQRTFGKGRVQEMLPLGDGRGMLVLSTGTFQRPSGKTIDRNDVPAGSTEAGIAPDPRMDVLVEGNEYDAWLEHASLLDAAVQLTQAEQQSAAPDRVLERAVQVIDDALR